MRALSQPPTGLGSPLTSAFIEELINGVDGGTNADIHSLISFFNVFPRDYNFIIVLKPVVDRNTELSRLGGSVQPGGPDQLSASRHNSKDTSVEQEQNGNHRGFAKRVAPAALTVRSKRKSGNL